MGWWDVVWNAGFRGFLHMIEESQFEQFKQEHLEEIANMKTEQGLPLNIQIIYFEAMV